MLLRISKRGGFRQQAAFHPSPSLARPQKKSGRIFVRGGKSTYLRAINGSKNACFRRKGRKTNQLQRNFLPFPMKYQRLASRTMRGGFRQKAALLRCPAWDLGVGTSDSFFCAEKKIYPVPSGPRRSQAVRSGPIPPGGAPVSDPASCPCASFWSAADRILRFSGTRKRPARPTSVRRDFRLFRVFCPA
jgi:hypothetical protein